MGLPVRRPYWLIAFILLVIGIGRDRGNNKKQEKIDKKYGIKYNDAYDIFMRSPDIIIKEQANEFIKKRITKRWITITGNKHQFKVIHQANSGGNIDEKNFFQFSHCRISNLFTPNNLIDRLKRDVNNILLENEILNDIEKGNISSIKKNISKGYYIGYNFSNGDSPLIIASRLGKIEIVKLLLESGVDIENKSQDGRTALIHACIQGNTEIVKTLLKHGATNQESGLMGAIAKGHKEIVKILLKHGVNTEIRNKKGQTPLELANEKGDKEIINALLKNNNTL